MIEGEIDGIGDVDWDNVSLTLSDIAIEKLEEFNNMMRLSGYDQYYRAKILMGIHDRVKKVEVEILRGKRCRYRNREQIKGGHIASMGRYDNTWFLKGGGGYTSTLAVQPTPGGELAKRMRDNIGRIRAPDGGVTKVIEVGGDRLSKGLFRADPFKKKGCPFDKTCAISKKQTCTQNKAIYQLKCLLCTEENREAVAVYRGQSGCSIHKRCIEHIEAIRRGDAASGMGCHIREAHPEADLTGNSFIELTLVQQRDKNLERGIAEAVLIEEIEKDDKCITTNKKAEWGRAPLRRLTIQNNLL